MIIGTNFSLSWSRIMGESACTLNNLLVLTAANWTDAFIGLQPKLQEDPEAIMNYFQDVALWCVI